MSYSVTGVDVIGGVFIVIDVIVIDTIGDVSIAGNLVDAAVDGGAGVDCDIVVRCSIVNTTTTAAATTTQHTQPATL